jgi:hypothetical protein
MRRLLATFTALMLLSGVLGCTCTRGKCDCDQYVPCAGGFCGGEAAHLDPVVAAPAGTPAIGVEQLRQMPKAPGQQ